MNTMKIPKEKLVTILVENRVKHRSLFLKAQEVYRELVIKELDFMLEEAKKGSTIRRRVNLAAPADHTEDYDKMLGLFALSSDTHVELTLNEYNQYVNDNWAWSAADNALKQNYTARNISPMFVGEDHSMPTSY